MNTRASRTRGRQRNKVIFNIVGDIGYCRCKIVQLYGYKPMILIIISGEGDEASEEVGAGEEQKCGNDKCIMCTTLDRKDRGGGRGRERLCTPEKQREGEGEEEEGRRENSRFPPPPPLPKKTVAPYQEYR